MKNKAPPIKVKHYRYKINLCNNTTGYFFGEYGLNYYNFYNRKRGLYVFIQVLRAKDLKVFGYPKPSFSMITKNNYFNSTKGTFNIVSTNKIKNLFKAIKLQGGLEVGKVYNFYDKKYELNFISYGKYGSVSIYFIVDGKQLLRLSDHWSEGCKNIIVKECGNISSCIWKLQGNSFPFYFSCGSSVLISQWISTYYSGYWSKHYKSIDNCILAGIINLNELKLL